MSVEKIDADDAIIRITEVLIQADEDFIQRIANQVLSPNVQVGDASDPSDPETLFPGRYSVFVLRDDGTWEQPTYEITQQMSEADFRQCAESDCGGFICYGVQEDSDCPDENVRTL